MSSVNCHLVRNLLNNLSTRYNGHRKLPSKRRSLNRSDTPSPPLLKPSPPRRVQRPLTAYQYFIKFHFNKSKTFGPSVNPFAMASDEWRTMTDEQKRVYTEKANEWNTQNALLLQKLNRHRIDASKEDKVEPEQTATKRTRRIVSAYDMFLETKGNAIMQKAPPNMAPDIVLTNIWRTFGPEDKLEYEKLAREKTQLLKMASRKIVIGYDIFFACLYPTLRELQPSTHHLTLMNQVTRHWDKTQYSEKKLFRLASDRLKAAVVNQSFRKNSRTNRLLKDPTFMASILTLPFKKSDSKSFNLHFYEDEQRLLHIEGIYQYCKQRLWDRDESALENGAIVAKKHFAKFHPSEADQWPFLTDVKKKEWTMFHILTEHADESFIDFLSFMFTNRRHIEHNHPSLSLLQKYVILDHNWRRRHPLPQADLSDLPSASLKKLNEGSEKNMEETGKHLHFVERLQYRLIVPRHHSHTNPFVAFYSDWCKENENIGKTKRRAALTLASEAWQELSDDQRERYKQIGMKKTNKNRELREEKVKGILMQMTNREPKYSDDQVAHVVFPSMLTYPFSVFRCYLHLSLLADVNNGRCVDTFGKQVERVEREWQEAKDSLVAQGILTME